MSGTALTPGMIRNSAVNATWNLDRKLHCRSFNSSELLQCFRKQLEKEIIDAVVKILKHTVVSFKLITVQKIRLF